MITDESRPQESIDHQHVCDRTGALLACLADDDCRARDTLQVATATVEAIDRRQLASVLEGSR